MNLINIEYSVEFLLNCLKNYYTISERRYYDADELARDLILDIDYIIDKLKLTSKQEQILELYYKLGWTQEEIAGAWGTSQENICYHIKGIRKKLERYLKGGAVDVYK